jgi:pimeloyl-ACP methyl ester carboxylesterase
MEVLTCWNGDIELAYDTFGTVGRPLLLIAPMGAESRLMYHDDFCSALVDHGFHVARFDNRDGGRSTHRDSPYDLTDMARDAVAVLDALHWPSAHVFGASLGGMIGQVMAVRHPARVRTLTSVSSAPCALWRVSRTRLRTMVRVAAMLSRTKDPADRLVAMFRIVGSPTYPVDEQWLRHISQLSTPDHAADRRHLKAISASGDRRGELANVTAPTLVVHGEDDPLQSVRAGRATAAAVPNARLVTYPGMGHDLPRPLWPRVMAEMVALADRSRTDQPA